MTDSEIAKTGEELKKKTIIDMKLKVVRDKLVPMIEKNQYVGNFLVQLYGLENLLAVSEKPADCTHDGHKGSIELLKTCLNDVNAKTAMISKFSETLNQKKGDLVDYYEEQILHIRNQKTF